MAGLAQGEVTNEGVDRLWHFGHAQLDERSMELRVKGEPAALEPKPMAVLMHLLRHAGEVVTKDELAEACWPRRVLSESVLTKTISRVRDVLQDDDQTIIRTMHGYGYRLVARVMVSASTAAAPEPMLAFKPGDALPLRPDWVFVEQLGAGSSGEAWLARHEPSGEQRVFKFPLDVLGLGSLKREITLSRILEEPAGERVTRLLDWNLEQEPYFIEYEYAAGGNLLQWAERQGGLAAIALETRLSWIAEIAQTLATAHSVGVLHKDLKPSNVLVDDSGKLKLADFGSGGVVDSARLDALGITRLGFTRTLTAEDAGSGTPLYLAPEVLAGQPATVQGDIYALGVMLYQLVVGDFRRPMAPGWELDVQDEVLRSDIAAAAAGDARRRLGDAMALVDRLRDLEQRRVEHEQEKTERERVEAQRRMLERLQARRKWVVATITALVVGTVVSLGMYVEARRARSSADHAAATSDAVADFLSKDIFQAIGHIKKPPREWTVLDLLNSASLSIDRQFSERPEVAARLHASMGGAYMMLEETPQTERHLRRAIELGKQQDGGINAVTLKAAGVLVFPDHSAGRLPDTVKEYAALLREGEKRLGPDHESVRYLRQTIAWSYAALGQWSKALELVREHLARLDGNPEATPEDRAQALHSLGAYLIDAGEFTQADETLAKSRALYASLPDTNEFTMLQVNTIKIDLLIRTGRYAEARNLIEQTRTSAQRWAPKESNQFRTVLMLQECQLLLEEQNPSPALPLAEQLESMLGPTPTEPASDDRWMAYELSGLAKLQLGHLQQAELLLRRALEEGLKRNGPTHPWNLRVRLALADTLRRQRRIADSKSVFGASVPDVVAELPAKQPLRAEYYRIHGLLQAATGDKAGAKASLLQAERIFLDGLGTQHWKTRRAKAELETLS